MPSDEPRTATPDDESPEDMEDVTEAPGPPQPRFEVQWRGKQIGEFDSYSDAQAVALGYDDLREIKIIDRERPFPIGEGGTVD